MMCSSAYAGYSAWCASAVFADTMRYLSNRTGCMERTQKKSELLISSNRWNVCKDSTTCTALGIWALPDISNLLDWWRIAWEDLHAIDIRNEKKTL